MRDSVRIDFFGSQPWDYSTLIIKTDCRPRQSTDSAKGISRSASDCSSLNLEFNFPEG
jgi:hypothetical protein